MTYLPTVRTQKEYPHVTRNEAQLIWDAALTPMYRLFIKLLWYTGLRLNEVLPILAKHIQLSPDGYVLVIVRLKKRTRKEERLPIPRQLGQELTDYCKAARLQPSGRVFDGHENSYRYQVRQCARRAGLPNWQKIHPHSFRHGFVYEKVKAGVHPLVLTKLVGHSSLNITMQYFQPTEADLRQAIEQ